MIYVLAPIAGLLLLAAAYLVLCALSGAGKTPDND